MGTRFHLREDYEEPNWFSFAGAMLMTLLLLPVAWIVNLFVCLKAWGASRFGRAVAEQPELGGKSPDRIKRAG